MELTFAQIITSYNQKNRLKRAIESVLNQSVLPDEIIIGDDCSNDRSQDLILEYTSKYPGLIKPVLANKKGGIAKNFNKCINSSSCNFVSLLAGDDYLSPGKFESQFDCIRKYYPKYKVFYSDNYLYHERNEKRKLGTNKGKEGYVFSHLARRRFIMRNFWFETILFKTIGGFDESLEMYEDWKMKLELALNTEFKYCPGVFSFYCVHDIGIHKKPLEEHYHCIEKICSDVIKKYNLNKKEKRYLQASLGHYRTVASKTIYERVFNSIKTNLYDPRWLLPHIKSLLVYLLRKSSGNGGIKQLP